MWILILQIQLKERLNVFLYQICVYFNDDFNSGMYAELQNNAFLCMSTLTPSLRQLFWQVIACIRAQPEQYQHLQTQQHIHWYW